MYRALVNSLLNDSFNKEILENSNILMLDDNKINTQNINKEQLNIYIPGIGMTNEAFIASFQMIRNRLTGYTIALTPYGFGEANVNDINLEIQIKNIVDNILTLIMFYYKNIKKICFFGFSYGADILLRVIEKLHQKKPSIMIPYIVFADINIDKDSAFITNAIKEINNLNLSDDKDKKLQFLKEALGNTGNIPEEDFLEYFIMFNKTSWDTLSNISEEVVSNANNLITEINNSNTLFEAIGLEEIVFITSDSKDKISNILTLEDKYIINYYETHSHFECISPTIIISVNKFFSDNNSFNKAFESK